MKNRLTDSDCTKSRHGKEHWADGLLLNKQSYPVVRFEQPDPNVLNFV